MHQLRRFSLASTVSSEMTGRKDGSEDQPGWIQRGRRVSFSWQYGRLEMKHSVHSDTVFLKDSGGQRPGGEQESCKLSTVGTSSNSFLLRIERKIWVFEFPKPSSENLMDSVIWNWIYYTLLFIGMNFAINPASYLQNVLGQSLADSPKRSSLLPSLPGEKLCRN